MLAPEKLTVSEPAAATTVSKLPIAVIKALRPHRHDDQSPEAKTLIVSLPVPPMIVSPEPVAVTTRHRCQLDVGEISKNADRVAGAAEYIRIRAKDTDWLSAPLVSSTVMKAPKVNRVVGAARDEVKHR